MIPLKDILIWMAIGTLIFLGVLLVDILFLILTGTL